MVVMSGFHAVLAQSPGGLLWGGDLCLNCAYGACCDDEPEGERKKVKAIEELLVEWLGKGPWKSHEVAEAVNAHFDLAPKNSLYAFVQEISRLAKGPAYE